MTIPALPRALPRCLARSLALLVGALSAIAVAMPVAAPIVTSSDLASVALLVGGSGVVAWAAAQAAVTYRMTPVQAFGAGLALPAAILFLIPRGPRAANDNHRDFRDHPFSESWRQFISE